MIFKTNPVISFSCRLDVKVTHMEQWEYLFPSLTSNAILYRTCAGAFQRCFPTSTILCLYSSMISPTKCQERENMGQIIVLYEPFLWDIGFKTVTQKTLHFIRELITFHELRSLDLAGVQGIWSPAFLKSGWLLGISWQTVLHS